MSVFIESVTTIALKQLVDGIIEIFRKKGHQNEGKDNVLRALYNAINKTKTHLEALQAQNLEPIGNAELSQAWTDVGIMMKDLDRDTAKRFIKKGGYWANPTNWTDEDIIKSKIELQLIEDYADSLFGLDTAEKLLPVNDSKIVVPEVEIQVSEYHGFVEKFDIVIVTARFDTELSGFLRLARSKYYPDFIWERYNVENDSAIYRVGIIGGRRVLIATHDKMGLTSTSSLVTKVLFQFEPKFVIMGGILAGVDRNNQNFGDIIVTRETINYEAGKYKQNEITGETYFDYEPNQLSLNGNLIETMNEAIGDRSFLFNIWDEWEDGVSKPNEMVKALFETEVASGSAVVASDEKVKEIKEVAGRRFAGIDMETHGVFFAVKHFPNRRDEPVYAMSIKSISDFAGHDKDDRYRHYAAYTSARFIMDLIDRKMEDHFQ